jgi:D-alanine-D-alanine ligase
MNRLRVVVLMGGMSAEREISLRSGAKVLSALDPARYEASAVDLAGIVSARAADLAHLLFASTEGGGGCLDDAALRNGRPDIVFIALHGGAGENGTVQGMLELLGIPYTGSGVLASALAMNKIMSKKIFEREGIPTPRWVPLSAARRQGAAGLVLDSLGLPCVVKPACEGSTIGVTVVRDASELDGAIDAALCYGPEALAEEFIEGTEITGPVLGNDQPRVLPLVEIVPRGGFYDYEAKYTPGATEEIVPARITEAQTQRARQLTLEAHLALGCRGISRVDMMVGKDDVYVLEVNSIPGLTETSLVPRAAEAVGIAFPELVDRLIELGLEERGGRESARRA